MLSCKWIRLSVIIWLHANISPRLESYDFHHFHPPVLKHANMWLSRHLLCLKKNSPPFFGGSHHRNYSLHGVNTAASPTSHSADCQPRSSCVGLWLISPSISTPGHVCARWTSVRCRRRLITDRVLLIGSELAGPQQDVQGARSGGERNAAAPAQVLLLRPERGLQGPGPAQPALCSGERLHHRKPLCSSHSVVLPQPALWISLQLRGCSKRGRGQCERL